MRIYEFGVDGASPGLGGCIVILAHSADQARSLCRQEVERINQVRAKSKQPPVTADTSEIKSNRITLPAVVYSYDGEA